MNSPLALKITMQLKSPPNKADQSIRLSCV